MTEYTVDLVSPGSNTAEVWRRDGSGAATDRITIASLDTCGTNRTLRFEVEGATVIATDASDPSYRREYYVGDASHNETVEPL